MRFAKPYWTTRSWKELPSFDFNREIVKPCVLKNFRKGAVGIRVDDDFWTVAVLPYVYRDTPIDVLVEMLWPDMPRPYRHFGPDSPIVTRRTLLANTFGDWDKLMFRPVHNATHTTIGGQH